MVTYYKGLLRGVAAQYEQSLEKLYKDLPDDFKRVLLWGSGETEVEFTFWRAGKMSKLKRPFEGVIPNLERLYQESESEFTRNRLKAYMSPQFCDACQGQRLKPEILAVRLGDEAAAKNFGRAEASSQAGEGRRKQKRLEFPGLSIMDLCALSVERADDFLAGFRLTDFGQKIAQGII